MSRIPALLCLIVLLLGSISPHAARMTPKVACPQLKVVDEVVHGDGVLDEEGCTGIGEEDCLIRRTLAAHVDYIYTQSQKHKP